MYKYMTIFTNPFDFLKPHQYWIKFSKKSYQNEQFVLYDCAAWLANVHRLEMAFDNGACPLHAISGTIIRIPTLSLKKGCNSFLKLVNYRFNPYISTTGTCRQDAVTWLNEWVPIQ